MNQSRAHMILPMIIDDLDQFEPQLISNTQHFSPSMLTVSSSSSSRLIDDNSYFACYELQSKTQRNTCSVSVCSSDYIFPLPQIHVFVHHKHEHHDVIYCV